MDDCCFECHPLAPTSPGLVSLSWFGSAPGRHLRPARSLTAPWQIDPQELLAVIFTTTTTPCFPKLPPSFVFVKPPRSTTSSYGKDDQIPPRSQQQKSEFSQIQTQEKSGTNHHRLTKERIASPLFFAESTQTAHTHIHKRLLPRRQLSALPN